MTISEFIVKDLRGRIQSRDALPERLTLPGLAQLYSVSLTPVRTAVAELIEDDIIRKQPNGRLAIPTSVRRTTVEPAERPPDWPSIVHQDAIRESLRGESQKWKINETADRYGIGRGLVQSIFQRLAGMGILEHEPRCGWRVRPFREDDLDAYLEVRVLLELKALDSCRGQLERDVLQRIREGNRPGRGATEPLIDNSLHQYWVGLSGNRYVQDFFERHSAYYTALYEYAAIGGRQLAKIASLHRAILSALLERKWRVARDHLVEDIESLRPILLETIRTLGEWQNS
jgi:DNA-binding GntR family transcriptional regulator